MNGVLIKVSSKKLSIKRHMGKVSNKQLVESTYNLFHSFKYAHGEGNANDMVDHLETTYTTVEALVSYFNMFKHITYRKEYYPSSEKAYFTANTTENKENSMRMKLEKIMKTNKVRERGVNFMLELLEIVSDGVKHTDTSFKGFIKSIEMEDIIFVILLHSKEIKKSYIPKTLRLIRELQIEDNPLVEQFLVQLLLKVKLMNSSYHSMSIAEMVESLEILVKMKSFTVLRENIVLAAFQFIQTKLKVEFQNEIFSILTAISKMNLADRIDLEALEEFTTANSAELSLNSISRLLRSLDSAVLTPELRDRVIYLLKTTSSKLDIIFFYSSLREVDSTLSTVLADSFAEMSLSMTDSQLLDSTVYLLQAGVDLSSKIEFIADSLMRIDNTPTNLIKKAKLASMNDEIIPNLAEIQSKLETLKKQGKIKRKSIEILKI